VISPAVTSLLILLVCIILFVTEKFTMATTTVLGCVLMVLFGAANFNTVFSQFSSSSVVLLISMFVMGRALFDTGVTPILGRKLLSAARGSERRLLLLSVLLTSVITAFLSNVATLAMFITLFISFSKGDQDLDVRNFILPLGMASVVGSVMTLIGSAPQLSTQGYLLEAGFEGFKFFEYSLVGVPVTAVLVLYVTFIGYPLGKKIWGGRPREKMPDEVGSVAAKSRPRMVVMLTIFVTTILLLFWEPFPLPVIAASGALVSIMTGCISPKSAIQSVNWESAIKLGGCLGLLRAVDVLGGNDLMGEFFLKLLGSEFSPYLLLIAVIVVTQLISEFMANSVAILIVLPVAVSACIARGFNVRAYAMAITLAASTACCSPLANTSLTMTSVYGYRFFDYLKYNLLWNILAVLVIFLLVPVFFPLVR